MNLDAPGVRASLEAFLARAAGAAKATIIDGARLAGGAIQQNLRLTVALDAGPHAGTHSWVLRTDAPSAVAMSRTRVEEFRLLQVAFDAGVKVARPLFCHPGSASLAPCFVTAYCDGIAAGHRLTKAGAIADPPALLREIGANLGVIHALCPAVAALSFLGPPSRQPTHDLLVAAMHYLDHRRAGFGDAYPALEWGIHRVLQFVPAREDVVLLHRDYRIGNLLIDQGRLVAALDWEFAGWGNPLEDLGWFCAPCWRFAGRDRVAGGIGAADDFLAGYNGVRGTRWTSKDLKPWQALAQIRWAIIALQQAERHLSGAERSLELALTGRLLPELEHDLLRLVDD